LAAATPDQTETQARYTAFYLQQVARQEQALIGPAQRVALDAISAEIDNVQAAWVSAVNQRHLTQIAGALPAFYWFFQIRSRYAEGEERFSYALHQLDQAVTPMDENEFGRLRHQLLARRGALRLAQGELDAAEADFSVVLRSSADPRELAFVHAQLGNGARWRGNRPAAQAALQQSLALARTSGDHQQMAQALLGLADIASSFSQFAEGERFAREALALCRQLQRPDLTASVVASLAWATNCQGAYAESERYYRESLTIAESIGNPFTIGVAIQFLGWIAFCAGGARLAEAVTLYERAITIFRQIGHSNHLAMALGDYALAASERGDHAAALPAAQEGLAMMEALGHRSLMAYMLNGMGAAASGLDELAASRRYLLRSLQISFDAQTYDHAAVTLYLLAHLLFKESANAVYAEADRLATQLLALELLSTVIHTRDAWQPFRDRAQEAQTDLAATLPADRAAAAITRGQRRILAEVVAEVLQKFTLSAITSSGVG
jgi:tetratricopeptide (TPR) repeat protein